MNSVAIRGVTYKSYTEAGRALGVSASAVRKAKLRGTLDGVGLGRRISNAQVLLDWMTSHHRPLQLRRAADDDGGCWIVIDASDDSVRGSGGSAHDALAEAYRHDTTEASSD